MEMPKKSFGISLLVYVRQPELRETVKSVLAGLRIRTFDNSFFRETFEYVVSVVTSEAELAEKVIEILYLANSPKALVFVSDALLETTGQGTGFTAAAEVISQACFAHALPSALVSLSDEAVIPSALVAQISSRSFNEDQFFDALDRAALRVQLLCPAQGSPTTKLGNHSPSFHFGLINSPEQLIRCLEIRHGIYGVLGQLSPEIIDSKLGLEWDFHDGMSLHYAAVDARTNEIAASARLIIPHQPWGVIGSIVPELRDGFRTQQSWFRRLAENIHAPALQKKLLESGVGALPLLQNARIDTEWQTAVSAGLNGVELSRVVVNPQYRGLGLSRALVQMVIAGAYSLGRKTVFAECYPSHVQMYSAYGFKDIEGREAKLEQWGGFFATPQQLWLELTKPENANRLQAARWSAELFKMANTDIPDLNAEAPKTTTVENGLVIPTKKVANEK